MDTVRPSQRRAAVLLGLMALSGALAMSACGGGRAAEAQAVVAAAKPRERLDVFHDVYFRGGGAPASAPPRVALTATGLGACTAPLLARLHEPAPGKSGLPVTFFLEPAHVEVEHATDQAAVKATFARLTAEGHAVALAVDAIPSAWRADPAEFRAGLGREGGLLGQALRQAGGPAPRSPLVWRGPVQDDSLLGWGAVVDRPQVYWSLHLDLETTSPEVVEARVAATARDGDIIELAAPADGPRCGWVENVPALARGLEAAGLQVVDLTTLLRPELGRYEAARLIRYDGPGLGAACREALHLPPARPPAGSAPVGPLRDPSARAVRWGLLAHDDATHLKVLPLPGGEGTLGALIGGEAADAASLWARRREWRGLPSCLVEVEPARRLGPVTPDGRVYVVDAAGATRRDARAVAAPERPAVLPTREDLVRVEARQRLPWRLRGLVAQTLAGLSLETPMLVEARATVGVVVGRPLSAGAAPDPAALRAAVAGFVQFTELSLGEYLFLARLYPGDSDALARTARAADGFLRPGPYVVLRGAPGAAPAPEHLGVTGGPNLETSPEALLARALAGGANLGPGDVVLWGPRPVEGGPDVSPGRARGVGRAAVRRLLAESVLRGSTRAAYLRPGNTFVADADLLGAIRFRLVVPPGVHMPDAVDLERVAGADEKTRATPDP